jgi:hypothetical protein
MTGQESGVQVNQNQRANRTEPERTEQQINKKEDK